MFKSGFIFSTEAQIAAAIHNKTPVIVSMDGEDLDHGGVIESPDDQTIKINGMYYVKAACAIRIRWFWFN